MIMQYSDIYWERGKLYNEFRFPQVSCDLRWVQTFRAVQATIHNNFLLLTPAVQVLYLLSFCTPDLCIYICIFSQRHSLHSGDSIVLRKVSIILQTYTELNPEELHLNHCHIENPKSRIFQEVSPQVFRMYSLPRPSYSHVHSIVT